jgi:hypothetical protein
MNSVQLDLVKSVASKAVARDSRNELFGFRRGIVDWQQHMVTNTILKALTLHLECDYYTDEQVECLLSKRKFGINEINNNCC